VRSIALVRIRGREIDVDITEELGEFVWTNAKWSNEKLIASSPFRYDKSPSFFVNLQGEYPGSWGDSGAYEPEHESGNLIKLLSFLRDETYEETEEYLLLRYDYEYTSKASIEIEFPSLDKRKPYAIVPEEVYEGKSIDYEYLQKRRIHPKVIELQGVFDAGNAIGIPWRNSRGDILNIKYRMKRGKSFWYEKGATPIRRLVYGLDTVLKRGIARVVICEAEIDAMTWQSMGTYAIAVGGVSFTEHQAEKIISSGIREIILGGDNDKAGQRFNEKVRDQLENYVEIKEIDYDTYNGKKDANELGPSGLRNVKIKPSGLRATLI